MESYRINRSHALHRPICSPPTTTITKATGSAKIQYELPRILIRVPPSATPKRRGLALMPPDQSLKAQTASLMTHRPLVPANPSSSAVLRCHTSLAHSPSPCLNRTAYTAVQASPAPPFSRPTHPCRPIRPNDVEDAMAPSSLSLSPCRCLISGTTICLPQLALRLV